MNNHIKGAGSIAVVFCMFTGAANAAPPDDPAAIHAKIDDLKKQISQKAADRDAAMQASPEYTLAKKDCDAKLAALEQARKSGTPEEKLSASQEYGKSRTALNSIIAKYAKSQEEKDLERQLQQAEAELNIALRPKLHLKPGAPPIVVEWFNSLPDRAAKFMAGRRAALQQQIDAAETNLQNVKNRRVGMVSSGFGASQTDMGAIARKDRDYRDAKQGLEAAKQALKDFEAGTDSPEVMLWKAGSGPIGHLEVGAWGTLEDGAKVFQVVGPKDIILQLGERKLWLHGVSSATVVDDQAIRYDSEIIVTKTKTYDTAMGSTMTCFYAEPFPIKDYVTLE